VYDCKADAAWAAKYPNLDDPGRFERLVNRVNAVGAREGWALFECDGEGHPDLELQRDDCPDVGVPYFETDDAALAHVLAQARQGSSLHQAAIVLVDLVEQDLEADQDTQRHLQEQGRAVIR